MNVFRPLPFVLALTLASTVRADSKPIDLAKTPTAVQATVKTLLGANKIEGLVAEDDAYVVEWYDAKEDGHFATIAADGKVTQSEDDVKTTSLPAAALATLKAKRPTGTLDPAGTLIADESVDEEVANLGAATKPTK